MLASGSSSGFFNWLTGVLMAGGGFLAYGLVFLLLFLAGWLVPLPEEATVIAAGYVAKKSGLSIWIMWGCVVAGIMCGDLVIFMIGRRHGDWVFRLRLFRWLLPDERLARARRLFAEHGSKMAFFGRFIAGIRAVIFFTAGNLGVPVATFLIFDFLAMLLTIPVGLFGGWYFADHIDEAFRLAKQSQRFLVALIVGIVAVVLLVRWLHHKLQPKAMAEAMEGEAPAPVPPAEESATERTEGTEKLTR